MTRDDILFMARKAGFTHHHNPDLYDCMVASGKATERFAALVEDAATAAANARANTSWTLMCKKMVAAEREACAEVCADLYKQWEDDFANVRVGEDDPEIPNWFDCKLAIEARSET
jgi:hypothetical protein